MTPRSIGAVIGAGVALACAILVPRTRAQATEEVVFVVHDLRPDTGLVRGGIYASASVWTQPGHMVAECDVPVHDGTARCAMRLPGPGRYAFAYYHDANGNNRFDTDLLGLPGEGYGFSNDVRPGLGPPSFESAAFDVAAGARYETRVVAQYGWHP